MKELPIIAIMDDHSDIVTDIKNGAGYHVTDNSAEVLIDIIQKIKDTPEDYRTRGKISRHIYPHSKIA